MNQKVMFQLQYGLYVLTAKEEGKDNGCIINTAMQVTSSPNRIVISVSKKNLTHDMVRNTGKFNVSVLTENAPFSIFQHFGYQSGRDVNKFDGKLNSLRSENGICYVAQYAGAFLSGEVVSQWDLGTHTLFLADITEGAMLEEGTPITYTYYQDHVKQIPQEKAEVKGFRCKICGYIYEGDVLPDDFICPICKHGVADFEKIE